MASLEAISACSGSGKIIDTARFLEAPRRDNFDVPAIAQRTDIDQDSIRYEHASNFIQGMDHARRVNSSERPRQDGNIECLFWKW